MFVSLVDFEDVADSSRGFDQVDLFTIQPFSEGAAKRFVVNTTRTGAGAMAVTLPKGSALVYTIPGFKDFSDYSLLSLAVHSSALRDDLQVRLTTDQASWTSPRTLIQPGWNTVLIDIRRLESVRRFNIGGVETIELLLADAAGPVSFGLDDIMLVDNVRQIWPTPSGVTLYKRGLDYEIHLPNRPEAIRLAQGDDGLWRLSDLRPTVQLAGPDQPLPAGGERLELMGPRKVGRVEVIEHNAVRLRIANTWYFPTRRGEWVSMAVRQIRWEYTIYPDGRWITHMELNNAGGQKIAAVRLWLSEQVAWSDGAVSRDLVLRGFKGPVGRLSYLLPPKGLRGKTLMRNHMDPGSMAATIAGPASPAAGDVDGDGFDQSQGCYFLRSANGHCRFTITPPPGGLLDPAFRIAGPWKGPVSVNVQGLAVRSVLSTADGSAIFIVPGWIRRPVSVEVVGRPGLDGQPSVPVFSRQTGPPAD